MKEIYQRWLAIRNKWKMLEAEEMKLRKEIAYNILKNMPFPAKRKIFVDHDHTLEAKIKVRYNVDIPVYDSIYKRLTLPEKGAINLKPLIKLKEYKNLPKDSLLHEAVIEKPTAPELTFKRIT